jgi:hypothetical protein
MYGAVYLLKLFYPDMPMHVTCNGSKLCPFKVAMKQCKLKSLPNVKVNIRIRLCRYRKTESLIIISNAEYHKQGPDFDDLKIF